MREMQAGLAEAEQSAWQPRCTGCAFARTGELFTLTMQGWIDLDYFKSPLLEGRLPDGDDVLHGDFANIFNRGEAEANLAVVHREPHTTFIDVGRQDGDLHVPAFVDKELNLVGIRQFIRQQRGKEFDREVRL